MDRETTPPRKRHSKSVDDDSIIDLVIHEQMKLQMVKDRVADLEKNFTSISQKIINLKSLNIGLAKQNSELKICMKVLKNHILGKDAKDPMGNLPTPRTPRDSDTSDSS